MAEMYVKYDESVISKYLKDYYIQFIYCGMVLLRKRGIK